MSTFPRLWSNSCFLLLGLSAFTGASLGLHAQTAAPAKPPSSGTASGFSIETEMLTYRALESNGEAIACDVAAYLYGTQPDFKNLPNGAICNVGSGGPSNIGVVVLPFDRTVFSDFMIWRSDMQTMAEFQARGVNACEVPKPVAEAPTPEPPGAPRSRGLTASTATTATAAVGGVMGAMTPAGAMLATGQGILGLFAKSQAAEPVGGTIEDQAFMNNVSRELRDVNISVIMPDVYTPYALTSIDPAKSPFVVALDKLLHLRDCLANAKSPADPDVKNIDDFLASLAGGPTAAAAVPRPGGTTTTTTTTTAPAPPANTTPSRLESALNADGLAQRLGADPATGSHPRHRPPASPHGQGARVRRFGQPLHQYLRHQNELQRRLRRHLHTLQPQRRTGVLRQRLRLRRPHRLRRLPEAPPGLQTRPRRAGHLPARRLQGQVTRTA
jgi:hypothetical protein